jgi:3-phenylpropionate/trans-cinnamate dioxygenase ferredoxin reductase subunit
LTIVVLGAGQAAGALVGALRQAGSCEAVVLVGEEPTGPYQRPPLSKAWLKAQAGLDDVLMRPDAWYEENGVELRLGRKAIRIDRINRRILTDQGEAIDYDRLVLATGARPRVLARGEQGVRRVHYLRTLQDAEGLKADFGTGGDLVVIGGGYVGLEAAASARQLGLTVTVIEQADQVLARVASPTLGSFVRHLHEEQGVRFELGAAVEAVEGEGGGFASVKLADGRRIAGSVLLVGIGAVPNEELAREAGLACADGIVVNETGRTTDPNIFAVGDVARRTAPCGALNRLESVPSAVEQGRLVAAVLAGADCPAPETPWFWSDQYHIKLQMAGHPAGGASHVVR